MQAVTAHRGQHEIDRGNTSKVAEKTDHSSWCGRTLNVVLRCAPEAGEALLRSAARRTRPDSSSFVHRVVRQS